MLRARQSATTTLRLAAKFDLYEGVSQMTCGGCLVPGRADACLRDPLFLGAVAVSVVTSGL